MKNKLLQWMDKKAGGVTEAEIYQSRWVWYHTILALLMLVMCIIMLGIFTLLAVKL
tara:strand:- start:1013 stop:1180 length:168 start_codon:yes stop_codon:yes gene_type:complete